MAKLRSSVAATVANDATVLRVCSVHGIGGLIQNDSACFVVYETYKMELDEPMMDHLHARSFSVSAQNRSARAGSVACGAAPHGAQLS